MDNRKPITTFTDLKAWQECHKLALSVYKITNNFPSSEVYALSSQMRRAVTSVTSNIAEGFGRSTKSDKEHFYTMASGSLYEVKNQIMLAKDLGYVSDKTFKQAADQANIAHKLLNALIKVHHNSTKH